MRVLSSPVNLSAEQAVEKAMGSLNQKSLFDLFKRPRVIEKIHRQNVRLVYIPYIMAATMSNLSGGRAVSAFAAVEGLTGEAGMSSGKPVYEETELDDELLIRARIEESDAREKILKCAAMAVMNRKRALPVTEIFALDTIYKPTYVMRMNYSVGGNKKTLLRFVDAESGYVIYRYDHIWRSFPQLVKWFGGAGNGTGA